MPTSQNVMLFFKFWIILFRHSRTFFRKGDCLFKSCLPRNEFVKHWSYFSCEHSFCGRVSHRCVWVRRYSVHLQKLLQCPICRSALCLFQSPLQGIHKPLSLSVWPWVVLQSRDVLHLKRIAELFKFIRRELRRIVRNYTINYAEAGK